MFNNTKYNHGIDKTVDGWMDRWVDGGREVKAVLRIVYCNQKYIVRPAHRNNCLKGDGKKERT